MPVMKTPLILNREQREKRRRAIAAAVRSGKLTLAEIASRFGVTSQTVRNAYAEFGKAKR